MSIPLLLLLLLAVIGAAMLFAGLQDVDPASWRGDAGPYGPYRIDRYKGRVRGVRIGVPARSALAFELEAMLGLQRVTRELGWSTEARSGNARFDRTFHVLADDPAVEAWLCADPVRCEHLLALVDPKLPDGYAFRHFTCGGGRVFADYRADLGAPSPALLVAAVQQRLLAVVPDLPPPAPGHLPPIDARKRLLPFVTTASLLAFVAATFVIQVLMEPELPQTIDRFGLALASILFAAIVAVPAVAWVRRRYRGSSRAVQALASVFVFGCPSLLVLALGSVSAANRAFDTAKPTLVPARVVAGRTSRPLFRDPRRYVTVVVSGNAPLPATMELYAPTWIGATSGPVVLVAHRGALGMRWISNIRPQ